LLAQAAGKEGAHQTSDAGSCVGNAYYGKQGDREQRAVRASRRRPLLVDALMDVAVGIEKYREFGVLL